MNKDRGIIKWMPFQNFPEQKRTMDFILQEKQKRTKPVLSLEQQNTIETKIIEAFYEQIEITLKIYQKGRIETVTTKIIHLDSIYKRIYLANKKVILFSQIVEILF